MDFIVNNEWNPNANFYKLQLPYSVTVGDSVIAITIDPESTETDRIQAAFFQLLMNFDSVHSRGSMHPPIKCMILMCPNQATIDRTKSGTKLVHHLCDNCFKIINQLYIVIRNGGNRRFTIIGDYLGDLWEDGIIYLKKKYRWNDSGIPQMYADEIVNAVVSSYYPMWMIVRELPLLNDVTKYIMIYFALIE